jgi:hypothetical protein
MSGDADNTPACPPSKALGAFSMNLSIRNHLTYANVVATMALVFAMSGSALAAKHYLITSTSQISPKVLKKLKGANGKPGKEGLAGKEGATGKEGAAGKEGTAGKDGLSLISEEEQKKLLAVLPYIKFVALGAGGKPTIQFSGANVQIVSGGGKTDETNGEGNLIVGYDEGGGERTGSNNLVLGREQTYTSYGALIGGNGNFDDGPYSSILGGELNEAEGESSTVVGGIFNRTADEDDAILGGEFNLAEGRFSSVSGGYKNKATGENSSILGGKEIVESATDGVSP